MNSCWQLGDKRIDCSAPRIMAVLNATPDSFFEGSRISKLDEWWRADLAAVLAARPDIIDIGGQSTRPGSERVSAGEEAQRVVPLIEELRAQDAAIPITVDTYYAAVARVALDAGADGINDISAGRLDDGLWPLVKERGCGYVLMHMRGTPESMQRDPHYEDCVAEVLEFLTQRLAELTALGVKRGHIAVDPGIGFGKRLEDNLALISRARDLSKLQCPLLYGVSRKSFIGTLSGEADPSARLPGSLGVTWALLERGVMLHRVHDIAATRQLMAVWQGFSKT